MSFTDEQLNAWGEAAERGDYGGSKGPVMHGPIFPVDRSAFRLICWH